MAVDSRINQVIHLQERVQLDGADVVGIIADQFGQGGFTNFGQLVWSELELVIILVPIPIRISGDHELFGL